MQLVLLVLILTLQIKPPGTESPTKKHEGSSSTSQNAAQKQATPSNNAGVLPLANNVTVTAEHQDTGEKLEERNDRKAQLRLNRIYVWAAVIGVGANLGVLIVLVWQNTLTRRSANAAFLNAQAVINSERAYIVIKVEPAPGLYDYIAVNEGRTPAVVTSIYSAFLYAEREEDISGFLKYQDEEFPDHRIVPPKGTVDIRDWILGREAHLLEGKIFVFYGRVCYKDIVGKAHESRFCHKWDNIKHRLVRCEAKGGNEHT